MILPGRSGQPSVEESAPTRAKAPITHPSFAANIEVSLRTSRVVVARPAEELGGAARVDVLGLTGERQTGEGGVVRGGHRTDGLRGGALPGRPPSAPPVLRK